MVHGTEQTLTKDLLQVECYLLVSSWLRAALHKKTTYRGVKNLVTGVRKTYVHTT